MKKILKTISSFLCLFICLCIVAGFYNPSANAIGERKTVRIGWFVQPGYQETLEDGSPYGYCYEYLRTIAQYTNWKFEFVHGTLEECRVLLDAGEIDAMGCLSYTAERDNRYEMTDFPAGYTNCSIFVLNDSHIAQDDYAAIDGLRVAVRFGQNAEALLDFANKRNIELIPVYCTDYAALLSALHDGRADAAATGGYQPDADTRVIAQYAPTPFYFFIAKGKNDIIQGFNSAIESIKSQNPYYDILLSQKYLPSISTEFMLTKSELAYIKKAKPFSVIYNKNWAPLENMVDGVFTGIIADVYARISALTGLQFEFFSEEAVIGKADFVSAMDSDFDKAAQRGYDLSTSFLSLPMSYVTKSGAQGKTAIANYYYSYSKLQDQGYDFAFYSSAQECFDALTADSAGGVIINSYTSSNLLTQSKHSDFIETMVPGVTFDISIGVLQEHDPLLLSIVNKVLRFINPAEMNGIIIRNTVKNQELGFIELLNRIPTYIVVLVACAFLLIIIGLFILLIIRNRNTNVIQKMLYTDELTGILSPYGFEKYAQEILHKAPLEKHYFMIDFDVNGFQIFNFANGFGAGDQLLRSIAGQLTEFLLEGEICTRFAGDRFACLMYAKDSNDMHNRLYTFEQLLHSGSYHPSLLYSFGLYEIADRSESINTMNDYALIAKRAVKGDYENFIGQYDADLQHQRKVDAELVGSMENGLLQGQFTPYFQPKYDVYSKTIVGAEALVRWIRPTGMVPPDRFIELFEKSGLISKLDRYMFESVCQTLARQQKMGIPSVPISVNFSRKQLYAEDFAKYLLIVTQKYGVSPKLLEIELTETAFIENTEMIIHTIDELHQYGFLVSMDDFGSGFSSLNMLKDMPVDVLKIDLKFMQGFENGNRAGTVLTAVMRMARWLNMAVVAEGVETAEQVTFLRSIGCVCVQGYYYARPMPCDEYELRLINNTHGDATAAIKVYSAGDIHLLLDGNSRLSELLEKMLGAMGFYELNNGHLETLRVTDSYYTVMGYGDTRSFDLVESIHPEDHLLLMESLHEAWRSNRTVRGKMRRYGINQQQIHLEYRCRLVGGNENHPLFLIGYVNA